MSLSVLITGLITFLLCFVIHIIWWRCKHPKGDIRVLIFIFFIIPLGFAVFFYFLKLPFINLMSIALLHTALSCAYIISYPAVQADCPSLNILLAVNNSMPHGITEERIAYFLKGEVLLDVVVQKMIQEGFAEKKDDIIMPTRLGKLIASIFITFRSVLGIQQGKG